MNERILIIEDDPAILARAKGLQVRLTRIETGRVDLMQAGWRRRRAIRADRCRRVAARCCGPAAPG